VPRIYTRTGDQGETGLIGGARVPKDDLRVEAYGTLDEASSALGLLAAHLDAGLADAVREVQRTLFAIGAEMASPEPASTAGEPGRARAAAQPERAPSVGAADVEALERLIDGWEAGLPPLRAFVLPGGSPAAALCHLARSMVRRAERRAVALARSAPVNPEILRYLNRLSDCLFVMARLINHRAGIPDAAWEPERGA
jgi:cob(I)alamin adenosyltransferase